MGTQWILVYGDNTNILDRTVYTIKENRDPSKKVG